MARMTDGKALQIEITPQGSLRLSAEVAQRFFPADTLVVLTRGPELWLLPVRGPAAGGLLLKQRNPQGDRSVVLQGIVERDLPAGRHAAFWDGERGALRVTLMSVAET